MRNALTKTFSNPILTQILIMISASVSFLIYFGLTARDGFSALEPMLDGTAARPYVYRVLAAWVIRALSDLLLPNPYLSAVVVMYLSLLAFAWTVWGFVKIYLGPPASNIVGVVAPLGLVPFMFEQRHIYDLPTLFLFSLSLYFLAREKFFAFLIVFGLTSLSKETSVLLILVFAFYFRKRVARKKFLVLLSLESLIYVVIRFLLLWRFQNNPGGLVEFHLLDHITAYAHSPLFALAFFLIATSVAAWAIKNNRERPAFLREAFLIIGLPLLILYFFLGVPFEVRVFMEVYPVLLVLLTISTIEWMHRRQSKLDG